jgi:hypothetical protein
MGIAMSRTAGSPPHPSWIGRQPLQWLQAVADGRFILDDADGFRV